MCRLNEAGVCPPLDLRAQISGPAVPNSARRREECQEANVRRAHFLRKHGCSGAESSAKSAD